MSSHRSSIKNNVLLGDISDSGSLGSNSLNTSMAASQLIKTQNLKKQRPDSLLAKKKKASLTNADLLRFKNLEQILHEKKELIKPSLDPKSDQFRKDFLESIHSLIATLNQFISKEDQLDFSLYDTNNPLATEVDRMLSRAQDNLPPEKPYIPNEHDDVVEFVKSTYGKYLTSCGAEEDYLYQDQLREIHPDKVKVALLKRRIKSEQDKKSPNQEKIDSFNQEIQILGEQYGSPEWGYDVVKALQNYYQNNKTDSINTLIKGKNDRLDKERELLRKSNSGSKTQKSASRYTYLNYSK